MPVIDHGQNNVTAKLSTEHRYGCHNRAPFKDPCFSSHGDTWPFRMSRECRYDRSEIDPACAGCKHIGSGAAYIRRQEEGGAK